MSDSDSKHCRFIDRCPMFPQFRLKSVLAIYQRRYCQGRHEECERYKRASRGTMPDPDLLPDGDRLTSFADAECSAD